MLKEWSARISVEEKCKMPLFGFGKPNVEKMTEKGDIKGLLKQTFLLNKDHLSLEGDQTQNNFQLNCHLRKGALKACVLKPKFVDSSKVFVFSTFPFFLFPLQ
jgi:hypothetical protein